MNGIRLAALIVAAISLLHVDLGEAVAQPTQDQIDRMSAGRQGRPDRGSRSSSRTRDASGDQERGSRTSGRSSNSRRSRSSQSNRNNAIKTNPLFQLFDQDGDGELSLEEIDAASRLLYSLDANEDDAITSDEVEDMVADSGQAEDDEPPARSSRGSSRSRSSNSRSRTGGQPQDQPMSGGNPGEQGRSGRGSARGGATTRSGGRGFGSLGTAGVGGAPDAGTRSGGGGGQADDDEFGSYDKDGDGVLKRGEMPRSLRTKFTKMDSNGDKEIDEDEYWDYIDNN